MYFNEKLELWCLSKYKNLHSAAQALGIPQITLNRYTDGDNMPGTPFLIKIRKMGCDINWLLDEDNSDVSNDDIERNIDLLRKENYLIKHKLEKIASIVGQKK